MPKTPKQKLYCYVDETGQDPRAELFIVVAVVSGKAQEAIRQQLKDIEIKARIYQRKYSHSQFKRNKKYFELILKDKIGKVYFSSYKKPIPYFFPLLNLLEKAILATVKQVDYKIIIYVDGIDKKKALELTNALRELNIKAERVRSARDESEPLIRLADRWAGCIRKVFENNQDAKLIFEQAQKGEYLQKIDK